MHSQSLWSTFPQAAIPFPIHTHKKPCYTVQPPETKVFHTPLHSAPQSKLCSYTPMYTLLYMATCNQITQIFVAAPLIPRRKESVPEVLLSTKHLWDHEKRWNSWYFISTRLLVKTGKLLHLSSQLQDIIVILSRRGSSYSWNVIIARTLWCIMTRARPPLE